VGICKGNLFRACFFFTRFYKNFISQNSFDLKLGKIGKDTIEEAAKWAVEYYDLLMLTERFDESLILLKDMWKLDFEDIVSLKAKDNSAAQIFRVEDLSKNFTVEIVLRSIFSKFAFRISFSRKTTSTLFFTTLRAMRLTKKLQSSAAKR